MVDIQRQLCIGTPSGQRHVGRTVLCAGPRSQKDAPAAASAADVRCNRRLKRATTTRRAGKDSSRSRNCKAPRTLPEFPGKWRFTQWCVHGVGVHGRAAAGGAPSAEQRRERDVIQRHGWVRQPSGPQFRLGERHHGGIATLTRRGADGEGRSRLVRWPSGSISYRLGFFNFVSPNDRHRTCPSELPLAWRPPGS